MTLIDSKRAKAGEAATKELVLIIHRLESTTVQHEQWTIVLHSEVSHQIFTLCQTYQGRLNQAKPIIVFPFFVGKLSNN